MNRITFFGFISCLSLLVLPLLRADDAHTKGSAPQHISMGAEVKLEDYLVPGKTTLFDFYSEFCPPCRAMAPHLETLHKARADIAVVKVDINRPGTRGIDWKSPVAREFKLESIPHLKVYGPNGKLIAEGNEARNQVIHWIEAVEK
ncbi:MAG TPA: thioredoxin family protein [Opitutaceae bacterium]|nr:thioredoxin family protein [Opitutaceae bacterium]